MTLYRAANVTDRDFVVATWSSSYKNAHTAGMIASEDWADVMHAQITKLISRPGVDTIVAYEPPDFLYGFIAGDLTQDTPVVHYIYVKAPFRSQPTLRGRSGPRHARGLFKALGLDPTRPFLFTCRTAVVARLVDGNKIPRARFVPAAARYANHLQEQIE